MSAITTNQIGELLEQEKAGRATREFFQVFLDNPDRFNKELGKFGKVYIVPVEPKLGYDGLMKAAKFGWQSDDITRERFPIEGSERREVKIELYEFDEVVTGEQAAERIVADGYQLEGFDTLLAFAAIYPKEQLRRSIVQLKARWRGQGGGVRVPYLGCDGGTQRGLGLDWLTDKFSPNGQFLVSRK